MAYVALSPMPRRKLPSRRSAPLRPRLHCWRSPHCEPQPCDEPPHRLAGLTGFPRPTGIGAVARVHVQGGYQFRLCAASEALTEECFQRTPLEFATPHTHTVVFQNHSVVINATVVAEGGGKGWMKNPIPSYQSDFVSCDRVMPQGEHCPYKCPGCGAPTYAADGACPCKCAEVYPGIPEYVAADRDLFPDPLPGFDQEREYHQYAIEDTVLVPASIPPGDYVLGYRWDAEQTSQVWSSCADITIV